MSAEFPFMGGDVVSAIDRLPMFREYDWDFDKDRFRYDANGSRITLTGDEALAVWVYKALKTERNQYLAYSERYGISLKPFIGLVMSVDERLSELRRVIVECLLANPYIKRIESVSFDQKGDRLMVTIGITTIYGGINVNV